LVLTTLLTMVMNYLSNALPLFGHSNGEVLNPLPNACTPAGLTLRHLGRHLSGLAGLHGVSGTAGPPRCALRNPVLAAPAGESAQRRLLASLIWLYVRLSSMELRCKETLVLGLPTNLYLGLIAVATIADVITWL